jgi:hypothetical protein
MCMLLLILYMCQVEKAAYVFLLSVTKVDGLKDSFTNAKLFKLGNASRRTSDASDGRTPVISHATT